MTNTKIYKIAILIISYLIFNSSLLATNNEPLAAYKLNGLWHFIDYNGELLFEPKPLVNIGGYADGYFMVIANIDNEDRWCYMDLSGEIKIVTDADQLRNFSDSMAMAIYYVKEGEIDRKYAFLNYSGEMITEPVFIGATDFVNGLAFVVEKDKRGYINKKGEYVLELDERKFAYPFFEGLSQISDSEKFQFGYIDTNGRIVIPFEYDEAQMFSEGLAAVNIDGKFGFINRKNEMLIKPKWEFAMDFQGGVCFVGVPHQGYQPLWGLINNAGTLLVNFQYLEVKQFNEGIAVVRDSLGYWFIDNMANRIIEHPYSYADTFVNGYAWASLHQQEKFGFINPLGEYMVIIPKAQVMVDLRHNRRVF